MAIDATNSEGILVYKRDEFQFGGGQSNQWWWGRAVVDDGGGTRARATNGCQSVILMQSPSGKM